MKSKLLFIYFFFLTFTSCNLKSQNESECKQGFTSFKNDLSSWSYLDINRITSHFPDIMCPKDHFWRILSNTPLFGANSTGIFYVEQIPYEQINLLKRNYSFKDSISYYSTEALRIRHFTINDTSTSFSDAILNRYPIPTFYWGLNKNKDLSLKWLNELELINIPKEQIKYSVPDDLMIYILDAESGFFWKDKENIPPRPFLGDWTFGYSRGIAISKEEAIICYWFMIW